MMFLDGPGPGRSGTRPVRRSGTGRIQPERDFGRYVSPDEHFVACPNQVVLQLYR
jgi:hypothetical protein